MNADYLFVYGTLRRLSQHPMAHFLATHAQFVDYASYQGKLYCLTDYPVVVPSNNPQDVVHGEVYQLFDAEMLFAQLDHYEECDSEFPEPTEYIRIQQVVKLNSGISVNSWIYRFNRSLSGWQRISSGDFYRQ